MLPSQSLLQAQHGLARHAERQNGQVQIRRCGQWWSKLEGRTVSAVKSKLCIIKGIFISGSK